MSICIIKQLQQRLGGVPSHLLLLPGKAPCHVLRDNAKATNNHHVVHTPKRNNARSESIGARRRHQGSSGEGMLHSLSLQNY